MTRLLSNDTYNNGITRDNFTQYAHPYHNSRDQYNSFFPGDPDPIIPTKHKKFNDNNNKGNKGKFAALTIFAILLFIIITAAIGIFFVLTTYNQIFAQTNGYFTQKSNIYEGLGIKIKYFDPWQIGSKDDDPSCLDPCLIGLNTPHLEAIIVIMQYKLDMPEIKNECKCDTLLEFVKYVYGNMAKVEDLIFINDNQITLTDGNIPAIQMEFENKGDRITGKNLIYIFTKGPNSFYGILFATEKNEQYSKYLNDFKKLLNSLEFVSTNETKKKVPSFMIAKDNEEENQKEPLSQLEATDQQQSNQGNASENRLAEIGEKLDEVFSDNKGLTKEGLVNEIIALENEIINKTIIGQQEEQEQGSTTLEEQLKFKEYKGKFVQFQYPVEWDSVMTEGLEAKGVFTEGIHTPKDNRISFEIPNTKGAFTILIKDTDKKNFEEFLQEEIQSYLGIEDLGIKEQILEITDTTLSNEPAKKLIVNSEEFDTNLDNKLLRIITLHDNKEYSITYRMEKSSYDNYIPTIEKIIQSVKFPITQ